MRADSRGLSNSDRFRVFTRDLFTCQYCGRGAPDVLLRVDHVEPWSKGGRTEMKNLLTACHACNAGKRDTDGVDQALENKRDGEFWKAYEEFWGPDNSSVDAVDYAVSDFTDKVRGPIRFDFDVYAAAAELPTATDEYRLDSDIIAAFSGCF